MSLEYNNRNGYGYSFSDGQNDEWPARQLFPDAASDILIDGFLQGNCLVEAGPGTGKSHLIRDIMATADSLHIPSLALISHINGGSKQGVDNALYLLDEFQDQYGEDGIVIVDNVDYYGCSGSKAHRPYSRALSHTVVAERLTEIATDPTAPILYATTHDQLWREYHWLYGEKREDDQVTPVAEKLLGSFVCTRTFDGKLTEEAAVGLISSKVSSCEEASKALAAIEDYAGDLYFRHINHLPAPIQIDTIAEALAAVDAGTARHIRGTAGA